VYDSTENAVRCIAGVTGRTGRYLQWLTQAHKFQKTLEIGLAYGISTLHICSAHMKNEVEGFHTSIDPFQTKDWKSIGLLNLERSGFKNFRFFEEPSEYVLPRLCSSGEISSHDLILIDGNHLYDYALLDLFYASRLVKVGGFIVLDDTDTASIIEVLKYALKNWHFLIPYKPGCFGRVFTFQKRFEKDPRPWFFSLN
jgi:predicted O-methyltransferase YrrM